MMLAATPGLPADSGEAFSVFVGDISPDVNDFLLQETFRQFYPTVKSAKVRLAQGLPAGAMSLAAATRPADWPPLTPPGAPARD